MLTFVFVSALTAAMAAGQNLHSTRGPHKHSPYEGLFAGTTSSALAPIPVSGVTPVKPQLGPRPAELSPRPRQATERGPCNMPIIVGDASADPGILIHRKHLPAPRIRVVEASACQDKQ